MLGIRLHQLRRQDFGTGRTGFQGYRSTSTLRWVASITITFPAIWYKPTEHRKAEEPAYGQGLSGPAVNNPALKTVPDDQVAEPFDAIQKKQATALSAYEKLRLVLDPKLDGKEKRMGDRSQETPLEGTLRGGPRYAEAAHRAWFRRQTVTVPADWTPSLCAMFRDVR